MKVSVVIPMYNSGDVIVGAIHSVLSQTFSNWELIVVDDGSTDDSRTILETLLVGENFSQTITLISQSNKGVASARNAGLRVATGDFVAFLDSDDKWVSNKLESQLTVFNLKPEAFLTACLHSKRLGHSGLERISLRRLLFKNYFQPSCVMIRREVLDTVGFFPEGRRYAEEGDFFMRIAAEHPCFLDNKVLVEYGSGKRGFGVSGLSGNLREMEKGELFNLHNLMQSNRIGILTFYLAVSFSVIKYIRRVFVKKQLDPILSSLRKRK